MTTPVDKVQWWAAEGYIQQIDVSTFPTDCTVLGDPHLTYRSGPVKMTLSMILDGTITADIRDLIGGPVVITITPRVE